MDLHAIEEKAMQIVEKAKSDPEFHEQLTKEPIKAVENLLGVDLPDEQLKAIVETVKTKLALDDGIKNMGEKISGLFHKN